MDKIIDIHLTSNLDTLEKAIMFVERVRKGLKYDEISKINIIYHAGYYNLSSVIHGFVCELMVNCVKSGTEISLMRSEND